MGEGHKKITLVEGDKIISDDKKLADTFNKFFVDSVNSMDIKENKVLMTDTGDILDPVKKVLKKFESHPSIISISENISIENGFSFSEVTTEDIKLEVKNLEAKKASTFMGVPTIQLKNAIDIIAEPLKQIWNNEIIKNKKFATKLKCADISPIFKRLENILKKNYRPVSILSVVSKIFERIMQKQINLYVKKYLSPFLCGYRKGYNAQYALTAMIEKWKKSLDNKENAGAILMDLSKAFDTINHELLIAKLGAYGFDESALAIVLDYLSNRWQRTKINTSFSSWTQLLKGVPQGSVLGPLLFNIYINDLFIHLHTHACNFADDNSLNAFNKNIEELLLDLEYDTLTCIVWFEDNFMKLNEDKCHFLISGDINEHLFAKVGDELIWESSEEKLLGIIIDKHLNFNSHLTKLCRKVNGKVTALARIAKLLPFDKRRTVLKTFIESQFSYAPLVWMFCSRKINKKINCIHERALRLVYDDYFLPFEDLLRKDGSISIHHRNIHNVAIEMFKVKNKLCPSFISDLFKLKMGPPTRNGIVFVRPQVNTVFKGDNSFRIFGPIVWNDMLPERLKNCTTLSEFKNMIKMWVPEHCPCRLCKTYIQDLGFITISN